MSQAGVLVLGLSLVVVPWGIRNLIVFGRPIITTTHGGYTLLLYRTKMGLHDNLAYADALTLLERGADPNHAGADGMTFGKMLTEHRANFQQTHKPPPPEFTALWDWAQKHGIVQQTQ